jgi:antitoxin (DNA-binding transcriptional repressor) of toxin-antitoxin stability system
MEALEPRLLLAIFPTAYDTYLLEIINRGRADPAAEAARYSWDLNEGLAPGTITTAAKQPLAFSDSLIYTAQNHSQWMLDNDLFQHTGEGGSSPNDRMVDAGYSLSGGGATGENIGWKGISPTMPVVKTFVEDIHKNLYIDITEPSRGHRTNQMDPQWHEIGIGVKEGVFTSKGVDWNGVMVTEDLAFGGTRVFLAGVAYADTVLGDQFYTPGEGLDNITITATRASDGQVASTQSWPAGAYRIQLAPGTYTIVATGGSLGGTVTYNGVTIGSENIKRDFRPDMVQGNLPPTLTAVTPLTGANQDQDFTLTYDMLAAAANEADPEGATVRFRVESVTTGTLKKSGTAVVPGTTLLGPAESLTWHPAAGASGLLNAFTVKAWDGALASATAVQVQVQVTAAGAPEIAVEQGTASLVDGDPAPVPFGTVGVGATAPVIQFKILNLGNATLTLGALTLQSNVGFEVAQQPPQSVGAGSWANFSLRMLTAGAGAKSADVVLANNDANENPFNFKVAGTVSAAPPEIEVKQADTVLVDGSATPVDFGNVAMRAAAPELEFIINNLGGQTLTLGSVALDNDQGFSVSKAPATSLAAGASTTLKLRMDTNTAGAKAADVRFSSNDADENPFNFKVAGTVVGQQVALAAADPDASEQGPDKGLFVLTRTGPTAAPLTISYTVSGTAGNGTDYQRLSGQATFAAGSWVLLLDVTPIDDALVENAETVIVTLVDGTWLGYTLDPANKTGTVTITDNEPVVALAVPDATASENAGDKGTFRITRSNINLTMPLDVRYAMTGTAINGTDYVRLSGAATIPAGAAFVDMDIDAYDDASVEAAETAIMTLQTSTAYTLDAANKTGTVTIADNEPVVALAVPDATASENAGDTGTFRITRSNVNPATALNVPYVMTGTAINGGDYHRLWGTATIPAGAAFVDVDIDVWEDSYVETPETAIMTLQTSTAYALDAANKTGTVTIADNEPVVGIVATDPNALEQGPHAAVFTITRSNVGTQDLTVRVNRSGTASYPGDVLDWSYPVIPAGQTSTTLAITPIDDMAIEPPETFILTIDNSYVACGYAVDPAQKTATATITDNEPTVGIAATDGNMDEQGQDPGRFTITRSNVGSQDLVVSYTVGGTAVNGGDYYWTGWTWASGFPSTISGVVTIPAGSTPVAIDLVPYDDLFVEGIQTVILTLKDASTYIVSALNNSATATILDNEPTVGVAAQDAAASEDGPDKGIFRISRSNVGAADLAVLYDLSGTAQWNTDYTMPRGQAVIPAGATYVDVDVTPVNDSRIEPAETVILTLCRSQVTEAFPALRVNYWGPAVDAYAIDDANKSATVTVADFEPTVSLAATDAAAAEATPANTGTFTFSLDKPGATDLTIRYTVTGTAMNGSDYNPWPNMLTGSLLIPAGATTATITSTPVDDTLAEPAETVILTLTPGSTSYYIDGAQTTATVTILDNEPVLSVTAPDALAAEQGADPAQFQIALNGPATVPLTVRYTMTGTATNGTDYNTLNGTLTIPAGATTATLDVAAKDDFLAEPDETVILTLATSTAYTLAPGQGSATATIDDNEPSVGITATVPAASEQGPAPGTFRVARNAAAATPLTVDFTVGGTASTSGDYAPLGTSVVIPANQTAALITVTPIDDTLAEGNETVIVTLRGNPAFSVDPAAASATVTIADNEAMVDVIAQDPNASEDPGNPGVFRIRRNNVGATDQAVRYMMGGTASAWGDYATLTGTATIPAGATFVDVTLQPIDDVLPEGAETAILTLTPGTAYSVNPAGTSATVTIADNEPIVSLAAFDALAAENGGDKGTLRIWRNNIGAADLAIRYTTGGTASPG